MVRPEFKKRIKIQGLSKMGTHPLILQSRTQQSEQKRELGMWECDIKAPVNIK